MSKHLHEVEDLHIVSERPRIAEVTHKDGLVVVEGGECHRCERWPLTVVKYSVLDETASEVGVGLICVDCIAEMAFNDDTLIGKENQ